MFILLLNLLYQSCEVDRYYYPNFIDKKTDPQREFQQRGPRWEGLVTPKHPVLTILHWLTFTTVTLILRKFEIFFFKSWSFDW